MNDRVQTLREAYGAHHASAQTRQEVLNMKETNGKNFFAGRRVLVAALAVVLTLALAVGVMAAAGVFRMNVREAAPEEVFTGPLSESGEPYYWEGAKLVFSFDGPETCRKIRFRPAVMPYELNTYFSNALGDGWYDCISCEGMNDVAVQPCRIDVRYAPMFLDGGSLLLLYADDVSGVAEEEWNGYRVLSFRSHMEIGNSAGSHAVDCSYVILYQPELGQIITVSSMADNLDTLAEIAKGLEIEQTDETVSAADWHEHNEFLDCGVG